MAFGISMAVLFVYYNYIAPPAPQSEIQVVPKKPVPDGETRTATAKLEDDQEETALSLLETAVEAREITVNTPLMQLVLDTKGGVLTGYALRNYHAEADPKSPQRNLLTETKGSHALFLGLKGYAGFHENKVFDLASDKILKDGRREIVLSWSNGELRIEKNFTFGTKHSDYLVGVDYRITNLSQSDLVFSPYLRSQLRQKDLPAKKSGILSFLTFQQPNLYHYLYLKDDSLTEKSKWDDFDTPDVAKGNLHWLALADRYFIFAMIPPADLFKEAAAIFERHGDFLVGDLVAQDVSLKPGESVSGKWSSYIGPKELNRMRELGVFLEKSVDYGWFSVLAVPILWLMMFLHKFVPNWGLVIILLTFIVKSLLHPINKKAMQSMKGMQQLQPKLKEIKEKFAHDNKKQQQAIMQIFRTHKVNPMSGCLPMVLQLPVYIVLYKVLWNAIELYHAPFFGPYNDLSAPDPYYVMPGLLGVFMYLQQKLTPSATADPTQQKMMMIMPVMFTLFMLFLPLGLVLYIFVNTIMSVIQQYMIKKDITFVDIVKGCWRLKGA